MPPQLHMVARPAAFTINESPEFYGFTFGDTWNGWATPFFPKDQAERFAAYNDREIETHGRSGFDRVRYDPKRDAYLLTNEDGDFDVVEPQVIETTEGRRKVWPIGAWSYVWETRRHPSHRRAR